MKVMNIVSTVFLSGLLVVQPLGADAIDDVSDSLFDVAEMTHEEEDQCPENPNKVVAGECGCNVSDVDSDNDFLPDCFSDPDVSPPADNTPASIEEGIALAVKTKRLIKLLTKDLTPSTVAAIRRSLKNAQRAFSDSLDTTTFSSLQQIRIGALVKKMKKLQRGKTRGALWKQKKKAGLKAGSRVIKILS